MRRLEALTGTAARKAANATAQLVKAVSSELKVTVEDVPARLAALVEERKKFERELADAKRKLAMSGGGAAGGAAGAADNIVEVGGIKFLKLSVSGLPNNDLKALVDEGKAKVKSGVVAVANNAPDGKGGLVVGVTADLTSRFNAVELVRKGAEALGGKGGGGRPDMAQAGGPDGSKADAALAAVQAALAG